jgi:hypothetical protein
MPVMLPSPPSGGVPSVYRWGPRPDGMLAMVTTMAATTGSTGVNVNDTTGAAAIASTIAVSRRPCWPASLTRPNPRTPTADDGSGRVGDQPSDIAAQLGHRDGGALPLKIYVHPLAEGLARAGAPLDQVIGGKR